MDDEDDGDPLEVWGAETAEDLHRILVLHAPMRRGSDANEPLWLLRKHHKTEPVTSVETAVLLLTDRRWQNGVGRLVRLIEESDILPADHLDLLARAFVTADDAVFWEVPDSWFGEDSIVIDVETGNVVIDSSDEDDATDVGPTIARRELAPPLRRWAAARLLHKDPAGWTRMASRARQLDARSGSALVNGLVDAADALPSTSRSRLLELVALWPNQKLRIRAAGILAADAAPDKPEPPDPQSSLF